jgi:hypothetical protein
MQNSDVGPAVERVLSDTSVEGAAWQAGGTDWSVPVRGLVSVKNG